jgi:hypothetical protein
MCESEMVRLLGRTDQWQAEVTVLDKARRPSAPPHDFSLPLLSLPLALGTPEPWHPPTPYLHADPVVRETWRRRMGSVPAFRVGLTWEGDAANPGDRHRSIPFDQIARLSPMPGVTFYSLQIRPRGVTPARLENAGLINLTDGIGDFADTAALISEMDLIITADTANAHLAGALGRPVWTLLPFVPDWRWLLNREDSPWYPTMRLFRQPAAGDWNAVMKRVTDELRTLQKSPARS